MSTAKRPKPQADEAERLKREWLARLSDLVDTVRDWADSLGWATRRIATKLDDSLIGSYEAPALIMQEGTTRVLLEPIARSAIGAEGVVDLYLMPGLDDIASLYHIDGEWQLHYAMPVLPAVATIRQAEHKPLTRDAFREVIEEMVKNGS